MEKKLRKRLRSEGQTLQATISVGRGGVSPGVLSELDSQLKRFHMVKVRLQRGAAGGDREEEAAITDELTSKLGAELVERRGHTVLIYRRGRRK
jgi:RNA-binding protein